MHARYHGKWYETLTFVQTTLFLKPTPRTEIWYEAMRLPGLLRIDIAPVDSGNTLLFRADSLYQYRQSAFHAGRSLVHPLMVLGFDVYGDPPERTAAKLTALGFDLSRIHEAEWQGRPAYVVGAAKGDTTAAQFWIDRERLLFVRMLQPAPNNAGISETLFNNYQRFGGGWVAVEVLFSLNGELTLKETYADVKVDVPLPDGLFDPDGYGRPGWVE